MAAGRTAIAGQAAAADVSAPIRRGTSGTNAGCQTQEAAGVYGQYDAWGNYVDGCTVDAASAHLWNNASYNYWARRRLWWWDASGFGSPDCYDSLATGITLNRWEWASVESNGVRAPEDGGATVSSWVAIGSHSATLGQLFK